MSIRMLLVFVCGISVAFPAVAGNLRETENPTPLDAYVAAPDNAYKYEIVATEERSKWTSIVVKLTSQNWLTEEEVDRTLWEHWMTICVPAKVEHETAFFFIGGGRNGGDAPRGSGGIVRRMAVNNACVGIELGQIPNQPLTFKDDGIARSEDSTIAYTWDKYMRTGDTKWPLRLPMTKSVVRAMDATQEILANLETNPITINDFIVAGGSKRGWTTWATAMVDTRVKAIMPLVIDMLNVIPSFHHHKAVYGFYAPAVKDYEDMGIMDRTDTPEYLALMKIVEPYHFLDRLTMPKFIINGAGDQFFLPDSSQFYYSELQGEKRLRYIPNTGHGLGEDVLDSAEAYIHSQLNGHALPEYAWSFPDANTIRVTTKETPKAVTLWQAHNPDVRDFRVDVAGKIYEPTPLEGDENGVFVGTVEEPEKGWRAFVIELTYDVPSESDIKFTTPIRITPDETPFEYVSPENPIKGYLTQ